MGQPGSAARAQATPHDDHFVFDLRNGARIWLSEAVRRGEIAERDAAAAIRNIDAGKATDVTEEQVKVWLGPVKDSFGNVGIARKLVADFGKWWNVRVYFKTGAHGDLVIIRGWPNGRQLLKGTRYRVDNIKIMELQIGRPGIMAAAKESAKFGLILVVAVDLVQFARDRNFAHLLGSLSIDVPAVALASAIGAAAGAVAGGIGFISAVALGPALIAFGAGVIAGYALYRLDKHFGLTEKVTAAYERGLDRLAEWWRRAGNEAQSLWTRFVNSNFVHDAERGFDNLGKTLSQGDMSFLTIQPLM